MWEGCSTQNSYILKLQKLMLIRLNYLTWKCSNHTQYRELEESCGDLVGLPSEAKLKRK